MIFVLNDEMLSNYHELPIIYWWIFARKGLYIICGVLTELAMASPEFVLFIQGMV